MPSIDIEAISIHMRLVSIALQLCETHNIPSRMFRERGDTYSNHILEQPWWMALGAQITTQPSIYCASVRVSSCHSSCVMVAALPPDRPRCLPLHVSSIRHSANHASLFSGASAANRAH